METDIRALHTEVRRMSDRYDDDILIWSEHQVELLRRLAAGDPANEAPDWLNIIAEVADVGRDSLRVCRSQLFQALLHDLKAEAWPLSRDAPHWRSEARIARVNAADAYTPSMRQRIDVASLYAKALHAMPEFDRRPATAGGSRHLPRHAR